MMTRIFLAGLLLGSACARLDPDKEHVVGATDPQSFTPVAEAMHTRCGTLDCHGSPERNLRVYGQNGLRYLASGVSGQGATTPQEVEATYFSVLLLEPEILGQVISEGGDRPSRLQLVRKARGLDHHVGGSAARRGSAMDLCLLSWLAGAVNELECAQAAELLRPGQ